MSEAPSSVPPPAPERAFRRARRGLSLTVGVRALAAASPVVALATAAALLTRGAEDAARPAPAAVVVVDDDRDARAAIDAASASMGALEERARRFEDHAREAAQDLLVKRLEQDARTLAQAIAAARDARRARDPKRAASLPFDADELAPHVAPLALVESRAIEPEWPSSPPAPSGVGDEEPQPVTVVRAVLARDGSVVLPRGAAALVDVDLAAPGDSASIGRFTKIVDESRALVAARVCVAREPHCLYEAVAMPKDDRVARASEAVRAASAALAARASRAPVDEPAPSRDDDVVVVARATAARALGLGALVGILCALLATWRAARVGTAIAIRAHGLRAIAAGGSSTTTDARAPSEIAELDRAIASVAERLDDARASERQFRARGAALVDAARALLAIARGERSESALPASLDDGNDTDAHELARAVGALADALAERGAALDRAVLALEQPSEDPRASVDELTERVAALRPLAALLSDIATRTRALATRAAESPSEPALADELSRLSDAVKRRADTADALVQSLADAIARTVTARTSTKMSEPALAALKDEIRALSLRAPTAPDA